MVTEAVVELRTDRQLLTDLPLGRVARILVRVHMSTWKEPGVSFHMVHDHDLAGLVVQERAVDRQVLGGTSGLRTRNNGAPEPIHVRISA
ncbi:hypothetical protein GCM10009642_38160 [Nocardiopsis metallicus]